MQWVFSGSSDAVPNPFTSFLSVSWGLIGDVDIGADFLRPQVPATAHGAPMIAPHRRVRMQAWVLDLILAGDVLTVRYCAPQLGAGRFTHSYTRRLRYPRLYTGTLAYRPAGVSLAEAPLPPLGTPLDERAGWETLEGPFLMLWACNVPWMTLTSHVAPDAELDDGLWQLAVGHGPELACCSAAELRALVMEIQVSPEREKSSASRGPALLSPFFPL